MRLFMQQPTPGSEPPRYVQLILQPDLLGAWLLLRESGQIGGRSQLRRQQFLDHDSALAAFEAARDQQLARGFKVTFAEGSGAPRKESA